MGKFCPMCKNVGGSSISVDIPAIHRSFKNGHMIGNQIVLIAAQHESEARRLAPVRTGRLRREHYHKVFPVVTGPSRAYVTGTHVDYAIFLFGTAGKGSGWITANSHEQLELRPHPYSWFVGMDNPGRFQDRVKGQKPHPKRNWLKRALLVVLARRRVLTIDAAKAMAEEMDAGNA
jgi:hypothetical protein